MSKSGFEKATEKMFRDSGTSVQIVRPDSVQRMSREEREGLRRSEEERQRGEEEKQRGEERRQLIKDLVDMNVIPSEKSSDVVQEKTAEAEAGQVVERRQGRGRPVKNPDIKEYVLLNFRVPVDYRQRIKVIAAQQGRTVSELFEEAIGLLFGKYE